MARILLAEDEDVLRELMQRALGMDGHEVVAASDGAEALERLSAAGAAYDLLLSDIQMPVMDGIALALAAARDHPSLRIMLMTGYAHQRERANGLDQLVHDVIAKPVTIADLRARVTAAIAAA